MRDGFSSLLGVNKNIFLFCFDDNQSKQVIIPVPMLRLFLLMSLYAWFNLFSVIIYHQTRLICNCRFWFLFQAFGKSVKIISRRVN